MIYNLLIEARKKLLNIDFFGSPVQKNDDVFFGNRDNYIYFYWIKNNSTVNFKYIPTICVT